MIHGTNRQYRYGCRCQACRAAHTVAAAKYRERAAFTTRKVPTEPISEGWRDEGVCAGSDPDLFYPDRGEDTRKAKAMCRECPVTESCLSWALVNDESGVWGGTTWEERRWMQRRTG